MVVVSIKLAWEFFNKNEFDQVQSILDEIQPEDIELDIKKSILQARLWINSDPSKYAEAIEYSLSAIEKSKSIDNEVLQAISMYTAGLGNTRLCYYSIAEKHLFEAKMIYDSSAEYKDWDKHWELIKNESSQTQFTVLLSVLRLLVNNSILQGNLISAIENNTMLLNILEQGDMDEIAKNQVKLFSAIIMRLQGHLQESHQIFHDLRDYYHSKNDRVRLAAVIGNMGIIYYNQGNYKRAEHFLRQSYEIFVEIKLPEFTFQILILLIINSEARGSKSGAFTYFQELSSLYLKYANEKFILYFKFSQAYILKSSSRHKQLGEALKLFEHIVNKSVIDFEIYVWSLINLCEMLFDEYYHSDDLAYLQKINNFIEQLMVIGKHQEAPLIIVEASLLLSRMYIAQQNLKDAKHVLYESEIIVKEKGYVRHEKIISSQIDEIIFLEKKDRSTILIDDELLGDPDSSIKYELRKLAKDKLINENLTEERPLLVLIIDESGVKMYSKYFDEELNDLNLHLFANFLFSLNLFSNEAFVMSGGIKRISFQNYTLVIKPLKSTLCCYFYEGESSYAVKKLGHLIAKIQENNILLDYLISDHFIVSKEFVNELENIVSQVFV